MEGSPDEGHDPVKPTQPQQAFDEPGPLPRRHYISDQWRCNVDHAEQHFHRQAGLDCGIAKVGLRPRLPVGAASQVMAGSNQIVSEPRRLSPCYRSASFWSCRGGWVCSCPPASMLDSRDESLTGFVQQSHHPPLPSCPPSRRRGVQSSISASRRAWRLAKASTSTAAAADSAGPGRRSVAWAMSPCRISEYLRIASPRPGCAS